MFRITRSILSSGTLFLYRRHPAGFQVAWVSRLPPNLKYKKAIERDPCPPPPIPPIPPPRDDSLFWSAMAVVFVAGGFVVYAKGSPELRDWLTINAPWFDDLIAVAYQENMTYSEFIAQCIEDLKRCIQKCLSKDSKPKQCSLDSPPRPGKAVPDKPKRDGDEKEPVPCDVITPQVTKDISEIERCLKDLGEETVINYMTARDACAYYNKLVDETMMNFSISAMKDLYGAKAERADLVKQSLDNCAAAQDSFDELKHKFDCEVKAPKEAMDKTNALIKIYQDKMETNRIEFTWEHDKSLIMDKQWQKVETSMEKYMEENKTLFPGLRNDKKPTLQGDVDLLLYHTYRYVQSLKEELNEASAGLTERINRGLDSFPQNGMQKSSRELAIQSAVTLKRAEMAKEYTKRYEDQRLANERILKDSLKKQLARQDEVLHLRLDQKEKEVMVKLDQIVSEKVATEKKLFTKLLAEMAATLKHVEETLNARLKAERETRRSQELWTAGASLLAATKKGDPYVKVDKELKAIEKASGDGDKLVTTVLKAIPDSVRSEGIVPESVLRQKYRVMEDTALKVALVEQDGAPLPVYFLSWLQSVFLFMKISGIPQAELNKPPDEPFKDLDTFDLLQRARFWMERGNLAMALRYISSLEGASRGAAATWYEAARAHLETRQVAEAVLAHAAALGLQYV